MYAEVENLIYHWAPIKSSLFLWRALFMYSKQYNEAGLSVGDFCPSHDDACTTGGDETVYNHGIHAVCSSTVVKTWKTIKNN